MRIFSKRKSKFAHSVLATHETPHTIQEVIDERQMDKAIEVEHNLSPVRSDDDQTGN